MLSLFGLLLATKKKGVFRSSIFKAFFPITLLASALTTFAANQSQIVIHCTSQTIIGHPDLLKNASNQTLTAGSQANGDGCMVTLGYYSNADSSSINNHFNGDWIPLTEGTRIGDSSSGYGFEDGMFSFTTVFTFESNVVNIFPTEPAFYQLTAPHNITNSAPPPGKPLCIRFYDSSSISKDTKFNAVTGHEWLWATFSGGIPDNLYLKISTGTPSAHSVWKYGSSLQYSADSFKTTEPVEYIPNLYSLTINTTNGGTTNDINASYPEDTSVEILATPNTHMEFVGWIGSGVSDPLFPSTVVFMTEDRNITAVFQPKKYELQVDFSGVGSVTGTGEYSYGANIPISAQASLGYEFSHWEGFGIDANTSSTTILISADQTIRAIFLPQQHNLTVSPYNSSHGTTTIIQSAPYRNGGIYDITAEAKDGYRFSHWTSTNNSIHMLDSNLTSTTKVRLSNDAQLIANFEEIQYRLDVLIGNGGQSVTPESGYFGVNQSVPVTATPEVGFHFTKWQDPSGLLNEPFSSSTFAIMNRATGDSFIRAQFDKKHYDVEITSGNGGNIIFDTPNGPWLHFGIYSIQAVPNLGYKFVSWNGNHVSINSLLLSHDQSTNQISVSSDISLNAHFVPESYNISVSSGTGGSATGSGQFSITDDPILEATASTGWEFSHWDGNETLLTLLSSTTSSKVFVDLSEAPPMLSYEAVFRRPHYEVQIQSSEGGKVNGKESATYLVESGSELSLQATPNKGWSFLRWYGVGNNSPTEPNLSITVSTELDITADFERKSYDLNIIQSSGGEASGGGTYKYAELITISASPKEGYRFLNWSGDIQYLKSSVSSQTEVNIPDKSLSFTPVFEIIPIEVSVSVSGSGSVTGAGQYNPQEIISLEAVGNPATGGAPRGFGLLKWTWTDENGQNHTSTDNPLILTSSKNIIVDAEFYPIPPEEVDFTIASTPGEAGILFDDPDQRVWNVDKDTIDRNISVASQPGFSFVGWSISPDADLSPHWKSQNIIASPRADSSLIAHFKPLLHMFDVSYDSNKGIVSSFSNTYAHGTNVDINVEPKAHYQFSGWEISKSHHAKISSGVSTVKSDANVLFINEQESPEYILARGHTYNFEISINNDSKFFISSTLNTDNSYTSEYTQGVTNSRISNGILVFTVPTNAPDLLYYSTSNDQLLGGIFRIISLNEKDILSFSNEKSVSPSILLDLKLIANFQDKNYQVNVSAGEGGRVDEVSDTFLNNDYVLLNATPNEHFQFLRWEGSESIENTNSASTKVKVSESLNIKAIFTPILYPLTLSTQPANAAVFSTTENKLAFAYGDLVEIKALPKSGFRFLEWYGDFISQENPLEITVNGPKQIVAKIATQPVEIDLIVKSLNYLGEHQTDLTGGTVNGPKLAQKNESVNFNAKVESGFDFLGWFDENNQVISSNLNATFTFSSDRTITAIFAEKSFELLVDVQPKYFGTLKWESDVTLEHINEKLPYGYAVDITANSLNKNRFEKWFFNSQAKVDIRENNIIFNMFEDMSISAKFLPAPSPFLTIKISPANAGKVVGDGEKSSSNVHYIFATPNDGFRFEKWEGPGIQDPLKANTSISFDEHTEITVYFSEDDEGGNGSIEPNMHFLDVSTSNTNHGLTNPTGKNYFGKSKVDILAKPKPGYVFSHWEGEGVANPDSASTYVNLENDLLVAAIFIPASSQQTSIKVEQVIETLDYLGNALKNDEVGGSIIGGTSFLSDYIPTFKAYPKDGYFFVRWENGFEQTLSTDESMSYKSPSNFLLKAIFQKKSYNIRVYAQPAEQTQIFWEGYGYSARHEHLVPHGTQISLTASKNDNYAFLNWQNDQINIPNYKETKIKHLVKSESSFTAIYYPLNTVNLQTSASPSGGGWVLGSGEYAYNSKHPIHAKANDGYKFLRWDGSQILDPFSQQTTINLDQNLEIKAIFEPDLDYTGDNSNANPGLHALEVVSANEEQGSVSGSGVYGTGWVDIVATAKFGFIFSHWDGSNISDSKNSKTKILVEDDSLATAYFSPKSLFVDSRDELNGWYSNDWIGSYWNAHGSPWAYHLILGWIFVQETSTNAYWVWISQLNGWYWLESTTFPYLFDSASNNWVYLSLDSSKPSELLIFRFKDKQWRRLKN